ncbi:hypothetical protein C9374_012060 [Naegleria lovaniensis]|uniref:Alpha/beta hydrolase fold-3 domain-containing protein n=1 Tax=Naegleria lovaniensis TaxID=51637 RepID=A0AA88GEM2_NAELO|nr:uncharacterized protein C9374_012060 [Naegleria lovaniensis]KAG2373453.1 hypothetical protein C9374_012060 [Naegleria lovaniensis]
MSLTAWLACLILAYLLYQVWKHWQQLTTSPLHTLTRLLHKLFLFKEQYLFSSKHLYGTHCSPQARALFSMVSPFAINDSDLSRLPERSDFIHMRKYLNFMMRSVLSQYDYERSLTLCTIQQQQQQQGKSVAVAPPKENANLHSTPPLQIKTFSRRPNLKSLWIYHSDENEPSKPVSSTPRKTLLYFHGGGYYFGSPESYAGFFIPFARRYGINVYMADYVLAPDHSFREIFPDAMAELIFAFRELQLQPQHVCLGGDSAGGNLILNLMKQLSNHSNHSSSSNSSSSSSSNNNRIPYSQLDKFLILSPWCDLEMTHESVFEKLNRNEMMLSRNLLLSCREGKVPFESDPSEFSVLKFSKRELKEMIRNKKIFLNYGDRERLREEIMKFSEMLKELKIEIEEQENSGSVQYIELVGRDMCHDYPFLFNYDLPEAWEALDRFAEFVKSE